MSPSSDIEHGGEYKPLPASEISAENEALLNPQEPYAATERPTLYVRATGARFGLLHLILAFFGGLVLSVCASTLFPALCLPFSSVSGDIDSADKVNIAAPSHVGSTERHHYPPVSPTNGDTALFPTNVGYAGPTPTGAEPAVVATAPSYPVHSGAPVLVTPNTKGGAKGAEKGGFDIFKHWGNLSPWYSIDRGVFGVDSSPEAPEQCAVTGLHFLHRHGARYPTAWGRCIF